MSNSYADLKGWQRSEFGEMRAASESYYRAQFLPFLPQARTVVEIGFGNGELLAWLRGRGCGVFGIDTDAELLYRATGAGFEVAESFRDLKNLPHGQVDAVVALDVFEHMPLEDLSVLLREVKSVLRPGGVCIARFPNGDSPYGRLYQYGDITHRTAIGSGILTQIATGANLRVEYLGAPAVPGLDVGLARWAKYCAMSLLRKAQEVWVSHVFFGGSRIVLSPNLVAVLRA